MTSPVYSQTSQPGQTAHVRAESSHSQTTDIVGGFGKQAGPARRYGAELPSVRQLGSRLALSLTGMLLLLAGWHFSTMHLGELIMATPQQAWQALHELLADPVSLQHLQLSVWRMLQGIALGSFAGFILGLAAGFYPWVRFLLHPLRWMLMAIPPVILVVLAMLWFGLGSQMVIFIASVLLAPGIYVNTEKAVRMIDPDLQEMARVYRLSALQKLLNLYIPAISASLTAAMLIALCNGVRIVVLAEVLGSEQGIGYAIASARSNFDSHELYAWVLIVLTIVAILEFLILQPIQYYLTRWQKGPAYAAA